MWLITMRNMIRLCQQATDSHADKDIIVEIVVQKALLQRQKPIWKISGVKKALFSTDVKKTDMIRRDIFTIRSVFLLE